MRDEIRLGRVAGFPLAVNWSVLVIAWLLTWNLATMSLPHSAGGHATATYWLVGVGTTLAFFASLLGHEFAHAVVARRNGVEVKGVTLWLLGGMAELSSEPPTPGSDFRIAIAGPAASIGLAAGLGVVSRSLDALGGAHLLATAVGWLATINLLLGVFNLLPGAPLDGGRLLRAALWARHGDRQQAARWATRAGTLTGTSLVALGFVQFVRGAGIAGLWLAFVGWFVVNAARTEASELAARTAGPDVTVLVTPAPPPDVPAAPTADRPLGRGDRTEARPHRALVRVESSARQHSASRFAVGASPWPPPPVPSDRSIGETGRVRR